jgi:hypothetical protein
MIFIAGKKLQCFFIGQFMFSVATALALFGYKEFVSMFCIKWFFEQIGIDILSCDIKFS